MIVIYSKKELSKPKVKRNWLPDSLTFKVELNVISDFICSFLIVMKIEGINQKHVLWRQKRAHVFIFVNVLNFYVYSDKNKVYKWGWIGQFHLNLQMSSDQNILLLHYINDW